jgi:hypothetical protein
VASLEEQEGLPPLEALVAWQAYQGEQVVLQALVAWQACQGEQVVLQALVA